MTEQKAKRLIEAFKELIRAEIKNNSGSKETDYFGSMVAEEKIKLILRDVRSF